MIIRKLLTAASVAALMAGAAYAQTATIALENVNASTDLSAAVKLAEEVDFAALDAADGNKVVVGLRVGTSAQIPAQNMLLRITATNATWDGAITGPALVGGGSGDTVIFSGGADGASTVEFIFTPDGSATSGSGYADSVTFNLPVAVSSCDDVEFSLTSFESQDGTTVDFGSAALAAPAVTCVDAFTASLASDGTDAALDYDSGADPIFSVFAAPDSGDTATLGEFDFSVDTTVLRNIATGDAVAASDVDGYSVTVAFESGTGIASCAAVDVSDFFAASAAVSGSSCVLTGTTDADSTTEDGTFTITIGSTTVAKQDVTVSATNLDLKAASLLDDEAFETGADVAELVYTGGQEFGRFDWVGDATKGTNNVFRITGLTAATDGRLQVTNSSTGLDGLYDFTVTPVGGEVILTKTELTTIAGNFGRADLTFFFESDASIDVDRLLSTGGVVSDFGNEDPT